MKKLSFLCTIPFLIALSFLLFSCSDNDSDEDLILDTNELQQTSWHGILEMRSIEGVITKAEVGFLFSTNDSGQYEIKYPEGTMPKHSYFVYSVNEKILAISPSDTIDIIGYWLLIEKGKDKMVLEQSIGAEFSQKATLTLVRNY